MMLKKKPQLVKSENHINLTFTFYGSNILNILIN